MAEVLQLHRQEVQEVTRLDMILLRMNALAMEMVKVNRLAKTSMPIEDIIAKARKVNGWYGLFREELAPYLSNRNVKDEYRLYVAAARNLQRLYRTNIFV